MDCDWVKNKLKRTVAHIAPYGHIAPNYPTYQDMFSTSMALEKDTDLGK